MRHKPETIEAARKLGAAGWTPSQIQRVFRQNGLELSWESIKRWTDPEYHERFNRNTRRDRANRAANRLRGRTHELRERGLSYDAIAAVLDIYHGKQITGEGVRRMLARDLQEASK